MARTRRPRLPAILLFRNANRRRPLIRPRPRPRRPDPVRDPWAFDQGDRGLRPLQ